MPDAPVVDRQTSKPVSFDELSVQVSAMAVVDVALAETPVGVATGAGVVAQSLPESGEEGTPAPPIALTL